MLREPQLPQHPPSLVSVLAGALRRDRSAGGGDDPEALEREVEALASQALARLMKEQAAASDATTTTTTTTPPPPPLLLQLPRRALAPGPTPGSLADLVDQAARAAQADAARADAEAAAQSGEDLRWALERHSLPAAAAGQVGAGVGDDEDDGNAAALAASSTATTTMITYAGLCAALAECPTTAAAAGIELPHDDDDASPPPPPDASSSPPLLPAAALFLRVERCSLSSPHENNSRLEEEEAAPTDVLADLLERRAAARQVRAELAAYDPRGSGWLSGAAVERWLCDTAPLLPPLEEEDGGGEDGSLLLPDELYARMAARKVFLFHGERRRRRRRAGAGSGGGVGGFSDGGGGAGGSARPSTCSDAAARVASAAVSGASRQLWVSAAELAASPLALELLEARAWRGRLRALAARWGDQEEEEQEEGGAEEEQWAERRARRAAAADALVGNWFSRQSARRALATFASWRVGVEGEGEGGGEGAPPQPPPPAPDGRGTLTLAQFSRIGGGGMSPLFLSRVFECAVSGSSVASGGGGAGGGGGSAPAQPPQPQQQRMMALPDFCDFVLAWDNRHRSSQALAYLFALLDLRGFGELSPADLYAHFREVRALLLPAGGEGGGGGGDAEADADGGVPSVRDVVAEIRDMVPGPSITREALWRSGLAGAVVGMLTSGDEFWAWNNRESGG